MDSRIGKSSAHFAEVSIKYSHCVTCVGSLVTAIGIMMKRSMYKNCPAISNKSIEGCEERTSKSPRDDANE
jgi:hypothetical protein